MYEKLQYKMYHMYYVGIVMVLNTLHRDQQLKVTYIWIGSKYHIGNIFIDNRIVKIFDWGSLFIIEFLEVDIANL